MSAPLRGLDLTRADGRCGIKSLLAEIARLSPGVIPANRWLVYTECDLCELRIRADLKRIARERGPGFVLWGRATTCRRMGCPGRVTFWVRPHGASGDVAMT